MKVLRGGQLYVLAKERQSGRLRNIFIPKSLKSRPAGEPYFVEVSRSFVEESGRIRKQFITLGFSLSLFRMNAIQTFWATPGLSVDQIDGGWLDPRYHFMGWSLSACLLNQHFGKTSLHTDITGQHILIDLLRLPYDEVHLTQEDFGVTYPPCWWVMRKIKSYSQTVPFLHVDGDAFLWNGLPTYLEPLPIIAQNQQTGFGCYDIAARQLINAGVSLPSFLGGPCAEYEAVNMGVVGGTDVAFFTDYVREVNHFYDTQLLGKAVDGLKTGYLNTLLEECFFQQYAIHRQKSVAFIITEKLHQEYRSISNSFDQSYGLTHLIGKSKKDISCCKQVEFELKRRFPAVYRRIITVIERGWRHQDIYSFAKSGSFPDSTALAQTLNPTLRVTLENHQAILSDYAHNSPLVNIICFERDKHHLFCDALDARDTLASDQQQRLGTLEKLANKPISERLNDQLCFAETVPLMHFRYAEKTVYYLAAYYDFTFGYQHIAHRMLDDLTIFILYACQEPTTLTVLIDRIIDKRSSGTDPVEKLIQQIDLRIKELLIFGLLDYLVANVIITTTQ